MQAGVTSRSLENEKYNTNLRVTGANKKQTLTMLRRHVEVATETKSYDQKLKVATDIGTGSTLFISKGPTF